MKINSREVQFAFVAREDNVSRGVHATRLGVEDCKGLIPGEEHCRMKEGYLSPVPSR